MKGDPPVMYRSHGAMIDVVSPPKRGLCIWGRKGANPPEDRGPIGPGIWVMRGEGGTPAMYRPHLAMIKVVFPPKEGMILWGRQGPIRTNEVHRDDLKALEIIIEGNPHVMYRYHLAMIKVVSPPKEGYTLCVGKGPIRTG